MKNSVVAPATVLVLLFFGCAVKYYTYTEGGYDPIFDMESVKTIGFIPFCNKKTVMNLLKRYFSLTPKKN